MPKSRSTLHDCIEHELREEMLEVKPCVKCKNSTKAFKNTIISKSPKHLVYIREDGNMFQTSSQSMLGDYFIERYARKYFLVSNNPNMVICAEIPEKLIF